MTIQELDNDTDFLCGSTSASYPTSAKRRNHNIAYQDVTRQIWDSADGWSYDDSNATTLPKARGTMVHNQEDVSLPTTAQRVRRIEVLDKGGIWHPLKLIDESEIPGALPEYLKTAGLPREYRMEGRSVIMYPKPHSAQVTLTSGIGVYVDRDITEFAVTATTSTPGFATAFHRILSLAASIDFIQDPNQRQFLAQQKQRLEQGLSRFYSGRSLERKTAIRPAGKKFWGQYI